MRAAVSAVPSSGSGQAGPSRGGRVRCSRIETLGAPERELRSAEVQVKARALRRIARLSPDSWAALFAVHNTSWSPLILGSLLALEAGAALEAALARASGRRDPGARGGRSQRGLPPGGIALVQGNVYVYVAAEDQLAPAPAGVDDALWGWGGARVVVNLGAHGRACLKVETMVRFFYPRKRVSGISWGPSSGRD